MRLSLREAEGWKVSKKDFNEELSRGLNGSLMSFKKRSTIQVEFFPNQELLYIDEPITLNIPVETDQSELYRIFTQDAVEKIVAKGEKDYTNILEWLGGIDLGTLFYIFKRTKEGYEFDIDELS